MNYTYKSSTAVFSIISLCIMGLLLAPAAVLAKNSKGESAAAEREEKREQKEFKKEQKFKLNFLKKVERDDDDNDDDDDDDDDERRRSECPRAFGHLIAPGFRAKNGTTTIPSNCPTPFGIWKKLPSWMLPGSGTTTPPDTTAPSISNIQSYAFSNAAFIWWTTNEPADAALFWSTSSGVDVNSSSTNRVERSTRTKNHHVYIGPLAATTTYHAVIRARDKAGNTSYSVPFSFTTGSGIVVTPPDTLAPTMSAVSATTSTSTITVQWSTNEPARSKLFYSTSTPVSTSATTTAFVESATLLTNHSLTITGLTASTSYYLVPQSKDAAGNATTSAEFATTTREVTI